MILFTGVLLVPVKQVYACAAPLADDGSFNCSGFSPPGGAQCTTQTYIDSIIGTESGGNYNCPNTTGASTALGRYQFLDGTRGDVCKNAGLPCVSRAAFANCPALQDAYFDAFNKSNYAALEACGAIGKIGTTVNGVQLTEACLMAAAHLRGAGSTGGGACHWVNSGGAVNLPDAYGTTPSSYCAKHGGSGPVFGSGADCPDSPPPGKTPPVCTKGPGIAVCRLPPNSVGSSP